MEWALSRSGFDSKLACLVSFVGNLVVQKGCWENFAGVSPFEMVKLVRSGGNCGGVSGTPSLESTGRVASVCKGWPFQRSTGRVASVWANKLVGALESPPL